MGRVRGLERTAGGSGTVGKFEKYRKVRSLAENNIIRTTSGFRRFLGSKPHKS